MTSTITLQAILLRFHSAVVSARQNSDTHQLLALQKSLDVLFDVLAFFQLTSLAALTQDLLDAVQDAISRVEWKTNLPTTNDLQTIVDSQLPVVIASYPAIVDVFVTQAVMQWAQATYGQAAATVVLQPNMVGTYGDEAYFWTIAVHTESSGSGIPVEIALDKDGYLSISYVIT